MEIQTREKGVDLESSTAQIRRRDTVPMDVTAVDGIPDRQASSAFET